MGDRFGDRERETRPGDWKCFDCNVNNFARRDSCFKCQKQKPSDGDEENTGGNYNSRSTGYSDRDGGNYRSGGRDGYRGGNDADRRYGGDRESRGYGGDRESRGYGGDRESRGYGGERESRGYRGDRDGERKSYRDDAPRRGGGGGGGGGPERREGDWDCNGCKSHNFSRRTECFRCGEVKAR